MSDGCGLGFHTRVRHETTVLKLHNAIATVVVAVVMANDQDCFSTRREIRQEKIIENLAVVRILVRRPLIEHVNRPVLKECGEER
jgi:hypothetical protein